MTKKLHEGLLFGIAGRCTRILQAKQVNSKEDLTTVMGAEEVVIKDVWIDADKPTEAQLLSQVLEDIRIFSDGEWEKHPLLKDFTLDWKEKLGELLRGDRYKDLFLRAAWESVGSGSKAVCSEVWKTNEIFKVDNTADRDPVWYPPELTCWRRMGPASPVIPVTIPRRSAPKIGGTCIPDYLESSSELSDFSPRKRCLFAFPEVCTPVSFLPTLADAMDVLRETHIALTLMFCAGWVHRDISVGNVLAIKNDGESGWHVKLADLEYAQRFPSDDTGGSAAQIGTPSFMAYEIESSTNMYQEPPSPSSSTSSMEDLLFKLNNPRPHVPITVAKHTFAHDSESLWWLAYGSSQFTSVMRSRIAKRASTSQGGLPILHPNLNLVRRALERVRYIICCGYTTRHPVNQLQDMSTYVDTCAAFPAFFDVVNREDKRAIWGPMKLYPMGHIAPAQEAPLSDVAQPASKKRKCEEDQEGGSVEGAQEPSQSSKEMPDTSTSQPPSSKKPRFDGDQPLQLSKYLLTPNHDHLPCWPKHSGRSASSSEMENAQDSADAITSRPSTPEEPERLSSDARDERKHAEREREKAVRKAIVKKMSKETVYCTNQDFIEYYLPPIPGDVDVDFVLDGLRYGWYIQKREGYEQNLLGEFSEKPSVIKAREGKRTNEKAIFAPLVNIITAIRKALGSSKNPFHLRMVPETRIKTDIRGCRVRIDACTTAASGPRKTLRTTDIIVPFEFKIHSTKVTKQENRSQIVSAMMHIMNDDVRRNFAYAVTIEDDHVSLWYLSRSHSVKATSFSYVKDPEKLVRVLTALSCATNEQLGYDARIALLQDGTYIYEFATSGEQKESAEVGVVNTPDSGHGSQTALNRAAALSLPSPMFYKMTRRLSEGLLFGVAGRCTRVFQAKQVYSKEDLTPVVGAQDIVIKDVWIDADKPTEAQLLSRVLEDIRIFSEGEWESHPLLKDFTDDWKAELGELLRGERYKDLFLRTVWESVSPLSKAICSEAWNTNQIFKVDNRTDRDFIWYPPYPTSMRRMGPDRPVVPVTIPRRCASRIAWTYIPDVESSRELSDFTPRKRCLFAFSDVCTAISDLPTLADAMDGLREAHMALTLMFCAGWVHRDISVGNVLAVKDDSGSVWHVKLADLEYAQKFPSNDDSSVAPKIGTPAFMACEIQSSRVMYRAPVLPRGDLSLKEYYSRIRARSPVPTKVAKHTYAHDSESLWWLILYIVTLHIGHEESYCNAYKYFHEHDVYTSRSSMSSEREDLLERGGLPIFHPDLTLICAALEEVCDIIRYGYNQRHPGKQIQDLTTYADTCSVFPAFFEIINKERAIWGPVKLYPIGHIAPAQQAAESAVTPPPETTQSGSKKRKCEEDQEEEAVKEAQQHSDCSKDTTDTSIGQPPPSKKPRL
ncbi:hypothetical protein NMY22_g12106 [Coprinellus aureogranulatus]|nr:hypothetical protein NMY22_g12106 [Coprinellus aureogranulatus]